jgi:cytochrome c553
MTSILNFFGVGQSRPSQAKHVAAFAEAVSRIEKASNQVTASLNDQDSEPLAAFVDDMRGVKKRKAGQSTGRGRNGQHRY